MKRIPFWATLFTLTGLLILCSLGLWQVQRLHWKTDLLTQIDTLYQTDAAATPIDSKTLTQADSAGLNFLRGTLHGHYLTKESFRSGPRPLDEQQGSHLYTPFQLQDGAIVLVNRGWIPDGTKIDMIPTPSGPTHATGLFRKPGTASRFTPPDNLTDDVFYQIDPAHIAAAKHLGSVLPYLLYLEQADNGTLPRAVSARPELNNNHQSYAIFWFSMAGVLLIIYILRFIHPLMTKRT